MFIEKTDRTPVQKPGFAEITGFLISRFLKPNYIGFIGCIEAEPDLAENCEAILMKEILASCKK
jgi:hypothetical protein